MAARTASELANWDGRLDQQRQNSKWRRSSNLAPYHTPLNLETSQPSTKLSDQKRAEQSPLRPNPERDSLANSPANARLSGRVDTTSTPSHDIHHHHHPSILHAPSRPALPQSPFPTTLSISSQLTPNSSVLASRPHNLPPPSSPLHIAFMQPASTMESEVIDLTIEDTEDELSVSDILVTNTAHFSNQPADPGPSRRSLYSGRSSPLLPEQSLFTPPPPHRRRTRLFIDYLEVPSFPNGLTKADYQPMSHYSVMPLPGPTVTNMPKPSSLAESPLTNQRTPSPQKRKGKEREHDVVSSRKKYKRRAPAHGADMTPNKLLDAFYEPTEIPLYEDDTYPLLTSLDLATNSRFQFAHAWRAHASRLREAELDWTFKFGILGRASIWAQSVDTSSPRVPGTTGYVSIEQLRSWELVPVEKSTEYVSDEQAHATKSRAVVDVDVDANYLLLPDDALPVPSVPVDSAFSNSTASHSSTVVDTEHDMNQYFNGLSDSPSKHVPSRQQFAQTHTFRPHLLQSDSLGLGFPSLDIHPQLADTSGHECFLGVPPSPTTADIESSLAPGPTPNSPFELASYFATSQSDVFGAHTWTLEQGEGLLLDDNSPPSNDVPPTALGTINPSLLGPEQPQTSSLGPKHTTPKRRSKLPEPIIYIRRPIDPSALPLVSGKRPVQIKYRDPGGSPATPSTSTSDTDEPPPAKKRSVPSHKPREDHAASESGSDYIPETSDSKIKLKSKRPAVGLVAARQGTEAETVPTMSFCHQCRNTSVRPKMLCSNTIEGRVCGKRFCNRCILYRYPDVTFDEHSAGFLCPVCTSTCNCSHCSRSRGEEFVSMRLGGLAASIFKSKVTLVRDGGERPHRAKSADMVTRRDASETALPIQSQFWAHVYGLEGDRVGRAFMTREHMERLHAPPSSSLALPKAQSQPVKKVQKPTRREKKRAKSKGPRVFIGRPLAWWKVRAVRDLEPSVDVDVGKGKEKEEGRGRRSRWYVGNPATLHESYGRMPGRASPTPPSTSSRCSTPTICSDGSLTPLSELDYNWPLPEVGECCEWAPSPPPGVMVVGRRASDPGLTGLSGSFGRQVTMGLGSGSGVDVTMDVAVNGDERGSTSTTLSEQDLARAISAALAALSFEPSC